MTTWRLFTIHGPQMGKTTHLDRLIRFGREEENEICIPDGQVSRVHAQIEKNDDSYLLTDLNSTNGTFVNDKRIAHPISLRIGDAITIGPARFLVLAETTDELG